jgi:hypothetical protein
LTYWRKIAARFPLLSNFARKYLSVCSTSVPSERLFSRAKRIVNARRANLIPDNAKVFLLVNCWQNELDEGDSPQYLL